MSRQSISRALMVLAVCGGVELPRRNEAGGKDETDMIMGRSIAPSQLMHTGRIWICSLLFGLTLAACQATTFVDVIVIRNDTVYDANVDVRGENGRWLSLATVSANSTSEVREVIDYGGTWTFRFYYGVHDPTEIEVSRKDLGEAAWTVDVPKGFERRLGAEGIVPPP